jgi:hypothetical protein
MIVLRIMIMVVVPVMMGRYGGGGETTCIGPVSGGFVVHF